MVSTIHAVCMHVNVCMYVCICRACCHALTLLTAFVNRTSHWDSTPPLHTHTHTHTLLVTYPAGVHNLHGMPGVIAAIGGSIAAAAAGESAYGALSYSSL